MNLNVKVPEGGNFNTPEIERVN